MTVAPLASERHIVALAVELGALSAGGVLSSAEKALAAAAVGESTDLSEVAAIRALILGGADPLGDLFYAERDAETRRATGSVYTPPEIVGPMTAWVMDQSPVRVVDAGCGSGRYTAEALRRDPELAVVAVDLDPIATLMTRAVVAVFNGQNSLVVNGDFTKIRLPLVEGVTAFLGNPPYLRHHQLPVAAKAWAQKASIALGHKISGLAGLHAYFYLAAAHLGRPGDIGCFVTSAEWLDVNYGSIIRNLLTSVLGGEEIHVIEPSAMPFDGTATTAAIVQFRMGTVPKGIGFRSVPRMADLAPLTANASPVAVERLTESPRWSVFLRTRTQVPAGYIELGELARVHRGAVTGANATWVSRGVVDLPESVLYPSITRAKELFAAGDMLSSADHLKRVIDMPADLDIFDADERKRIDRFLREARKASVHQGYVAKNRRAWWAVGLRAPAPILATYMARRPPAFVRNIAEARHINIAHGIYPREPMTDLQLQTLANLLSTTVALGQGRTYAGGLTKFEPREMERLPVPDLATLMNDATDPASEVGPSTSRK